MTSILHELDERNVTAQVSDRDSLIRHLAEKSRSVYCGFDPSAPSLHVGNLVPLLTLRRFQVAGHAPIALIGGATGLVGDPSERLDERALNDADTVNEWVERLSLQLVHFLDTTGTFAAHMVNNLDWTQNLSTIAFLRDIGKHFSVNAMIQRDSVRSRFERDASGISFTEFSYMLLQANDYLELHRRYGCTMQIGGSDQWGNIVSGIDLIRRIEQHQAYALTLKLLTKSSGEKFGKTATGAVWLDPALMSPYAFYQYWVNVADEDVNNLVDMLTTLRRDERDSLRIATRDAPEKRDSQKVLARYMTQLVHGNDACSSSERITDALFSGKVETLGEREVDQLWQDGLDRVEVQESVPLFVAMTDGGLAQSRSQARRLIKSRSVGVNGVNVHEENVNLSQKDALFGKYHLIKRGRKTWCIARHVEEM